MHVIEFIGPNAQIGLVARNGTAGPEAALVEGFKSYIPGCFRWKRGDVAIFHEPQIETGFPDLVVVQFLPQAFEFWSDERSALGHSEIKLMQHLMWSKAATVSELVGSLRRNGRGLDESLGRLLGAKMVTFSRGVWRPQARASTFGICSLVAVEAKVKNWGHALQQAQLDHWFASHSYVLSPVEKPTSRVLARADEIGIGVFLLNGSKVRHLRRAVGHKLPASYGSWQFNEWIGRYLYSQR